MEALLLGLLVLDLYLVVYYRLLIGQLQARRSGAAERGGILRVFTLPSRHSLEARHRKYYRRYWFALAGLALLVVAGIWLRYPALSRLGDAL
ncbi:MAG: hypothetical protein ACOZDY_07430 [Pseudomonadota bacterium]